MGRKYGCCRCRNRVLGMAIPPRPAPIRTSAASISDQVQERNIRTVEQHVGRDIQFDPLPRERDVDDRERRHGAACRQFTKLSQFLPVAGSASAQGSTPAFAVGRVRPPSAALSRRARRNALSGPRGVLESRCAIGVSIIVTGRGRRPRRLSGVLADREAAMSVMEPTGSSTQCACTRSPV